MGYEQSNNCNKNIDYEEVKLELEKKIVASLWLQVIGQFAEAIYSSKLLMLDNDSEGEKKITLGQWISAIGQAMEAVGATKQLTTMNKNLVLEAQKLALNGDILQSFGAALQALGGKEVIIEELLMNTPAT